MRCAAGRPFFYADRGGTRVDIGRDVTALGDVSPGLGYALAPTASSNDGPTVRAAVKLPTGDRSALAGSGQFSASAWAETSGALQWSADSRTWFYTASPGALAGEAPRNLPGPGGRFIAFGRVGAT